MLVIAPDGILHKAHYKGSLGTSDIWEKVRALCVVSAKRILCSFSPNLKKTPPPSNQQFFRYRE